MYHRLRQLSLRTRAAILVLCALMLVVQPVFAAVGELHELAHDPSGRHHALVLDTGAAPVVADQQSTPTETLILHTLLDGAHSCGTSAVMTPALPCVAKLTPTRTMLDRFSDHFPQRRLPAPFKPPIKA